MARYNIGGSVTCAYIFSVEADTEEEAEEKARQQLAEDYLVMDCESSDITIDTVDKE